MNPTGLFMDNTFGKSKKTKKAKGRSKTKGYSKQQGNKSAKTIPIQVHEKTAETNDEKLDSTLANDKAFLAMSNTIPQNVAEEKKVEVVETGDRGSAKLSNRVEVPEKVPNIAKNVTDSINDKSVISNPDPPSKIVTETFEQKDDEIENTEDRRSLTQDKNRGEDQERNMRQKKLNTAEIVPPIQDPDAQVFPPSSMNILAKSRKIRKKKRLMNHSHYNGTKTMSKAGMWAAFPGRKMKFSRKFTPSRGYSGYSGRSSRRRYKSSSRSSRSSRSGSLSKRYKSSRVKKMKRKYLRNILPHVGIQNKSKIVKKFTSPSN